MGAGHHHGRPARSGAERRRPVVVGDATGEPVGSDEVDLLHIPESTNRGLVALVLLLAVATLVGLLALWPSGDGVRDARRAISGSVSGSLTTALHDARLERIDPLPCPGGPFDGVTAEPECGVLQLRMLEGPDAGETVALEDYDLGRARYELGEVLVLSYDTKAEPGFEYRVADRQRSAVLAWLAVLFAAAVVVLGRFRGLAALAGLGLSLVVLLAFTVPALLDGSSPIAVALVTASAVAFCAIYLAHGVNAMSTVALLGTLSALALTTALSTVFVDLARINLLFSEEAAYLRLGDASVDLRGLFLAGVIIGALGALDDMTVTQASAVWELRSADRGASVRELYRRGIRIGRDHVASTVNTLVLAYAGASMPLLLLFAVLDQPLLDVANGELLAAEIVRTLLGSIGLVAAVPLTTWLAAVTVVRGPDDALDQR